MRRRFNECDEDPKPLQFLAKAFAEAFQTPFRGVVKTAGRQGALATGAGDLDDPTGSPCAHGGNEGPRDVHRRQQVEADLPFDVRVGKLFGGADDAAAGVVDQDIDRAAGLGALDHGCDVPLHGHVEPFDNELVTVACCQVVERLGTPDGGREVIPRSQDDFGKMATDAAGCAGFFALHMKQKSLDYMYQPLRALNMSTIVDIYNYFKCNEHNRGIASQSQLRAILQVRYRSCTKH